MHPAHCLRIGAASLVLLLIGKPVLAQHESPVTISGLGSISFQVTSPSDSAKRAFLRGALLLHVFHYAEAAASFREAQRLDPAMVMAYWGEAMTHTHAVWNEQDAAAARTALGRLGTTRDDRLSKAATPREKAYLAAVEVLYGDGEKATRDTLYARAMEQLAADHPGDDEAQLFYALALLGLNQGVRHHGDYMKATAIASSVMARNPSHPGASHYLIHGVDDPEHAVLGLPAAERLAKAAPEAGHAQHMTSHIFVALGMWEDVVRANETAVSVQAAAARRAGRPPARCGHYNAWLDYGYLQQNRVTEARSLLEGCRAQAAGSGGEMSGHQMDPDAAALSSFIAMWARYVIDTEDWAGEVAMWPIDAGRTPGPRLTLAFGRALAAAKQRDQAGFGNARRAWMQARAEMQTELASSGPSDPGTAEYLKRVDVLDLELQALNSSLNGEAEEAVTLLRRATVIEEGMAYAFGPPFVDKPAHELLGEELLHLGRAADAIAAFRKAAERNPGRVLALRGVARADSMLARSTGK
jgi:tetratricopeptide (TPR) repeat protein